MTCDSAACMQEPYTPLLPLMGSLLNDASANVGYSPGKPLSQTHSEQANVQILQNAGFCRIKVLVVCSVCDSSTLASKITPVVSTFHDAHLPLLKGAEMQVDKTQGLLLEQPVALEDYVHKGYQLVAVGFRPFFPGMDLLARAELSAIEKQFCAAATIIGQQKLNADGLVVDEHTDLWVVALAASNKAK